MTSTVETLYQSDGLPYYKITSPKTKQVYVVKKSNDGFCFYDVAVEVGSVPAFCQGKYTSPFFAIKQIQYYLDTMKESKAVARDNKYAENHPNGPKSKSDNQELVHTGSDN